MSATLAANPGRLSIVSVRWGSERSSSNSRWRGVPKIGAAVAGRLGLASVAARCRSGWASRSRDRLGDFLAVQLQGVAVSWILSRAVRRDALPVPAPGACQHREGPYRSTGCIIPWVGSAAIPQPPLGPAIGKSWPSWLASWCGQLAPGHNSAATRVWGSPDGPRLHRRCGRSGGTGP